MKTKLFLLLTCFISFIVSCKSESNQYTKFENAIKNSNCRLNLIDINNKITLTPSNESTYYEVNMSDSTNKHVQEIKEFNSMWAKKLNDFQNPKFFCIELQTAEQVKIDFSFSQVKYIYGTDNGITQFPQSSNQKSKISTGLNINNKENHYLLITIYKKGVKSQIVVKPNENYYNSNFEIGFSEELNKRIQINAYKLIKVN
jgi:hypothetical protein